MSEIVDSGDYKQPAESYNLVSQEYVKEKALAAGQMTIFYAGQVMVVDDFPPDKAMEIIMFSDWIRKHSPLVSDLPMARKASLARFLEKRKERITTARAAAPPQNECPSNHGSGHTTN